VCNFLLGKKCRREIFRALAKAIPHDYWFTTVAKFHGEKVRKRVKCDSHFKAVGRRKQSSQLQSMTLRLSYGDHHHTVSKRSYPAWWLNGKVGCVNRTMRLYCAPHTCNEKDLTEANEIASLNERYPGSHSTPKSKYHYHFLPN